MPSKQANVPNLDLATSNFNRGLRNPASQSADALKPESSLSPLTPRSPMSSPNSPLSFGKGSTIRPVTRRSKTEASLVALPSPRDPAEPATPSFTAMPQYPPSPKDSPKHNHDPSRSFFANLKASKSAHKITTSDSSGLSSENAPKSRGSSRDRANQPMSRGHGSTPDLLNAVGHAGRHKTEDTSDDQEGKPIHNGKTVSDSESSHGLAAKKHKPRFANLLARTRSIRVDDNSAPRSAGLRRPSNATLLKVTESKEEIQAPVKSAALRPDRPLNEAAGSGIRNRPADRPTENRPPTSRRDRAQGPTMVTSASLSQVSGASAALFNNLKQSSSGAADRLGKAGKGFFGKITRSGSTNEREIVMDDNYVCSVINLPLIEQTRKTRISKRLEDCRDKTEFWMPALPYRCIDYLNFRGTDEEGLYRVPGSGKEVKYWQRRFDSEGDVNLFDEPELYDINIVGSMFKAWLRELPDELLPKTTQQMIAEKCEGATTAPQLLKDELSRLPPYNYYLLFAITCHLNLLHNCAQQNKMDYRNLCICFQPCMKIDGFCFQFLVCDWKNCWQGCWTEKEWTKSEQEALEKERNPSPADRTENEALGSASTSGDERAIHSSGSSQPDQSEAKPKPAPSPRKSRPPRLENTHTHTRSVSQLPELGPPLSPIKI